MNKSLLLANTLYVAIPFLIGIASINNTKVESKIEYETRNIKALSIDAEESTSLVSAAKEKINVKIKFDYDDFSFTKEKENQDIDSYREEMFEAGRKYHSLKNLELISKLNVSNLSNLYISKYMPFFSFECENDELNDIYNNYLKGFEKKSYIEKINISRAENTLKPNLYSTKEDNNINYLFNNYDLDGTGIKVGILETGIADKTNEGINGRITVLDDWWIIEKVTDHATGMANIIGGRYGIAPKCTLYSAQVTGDVVHEFDWFLDNGVHIVNMSYGETNPTGVYNDNSAYIDSVVNTYGITCIAAVGNTGDTTGYVGNPGLGYNVFGIGQCDSDYEYPLSTSSYVEETGPDKPNIMAPGNFNIRDTASTISGTSCSSAYVSGVAALLMQGNEEFKLFPEKLFAVLSATNKSMKNDSNTTYRGLRDRYGVGIVDPLKAYKNYLNDEYVFFTTSVLETESINLYLEYGDRLKVCAWWRAYANGNKEDTAITDYDIYLLDSYLNKKYYCQSVKNNFEYFEYVISTTGWYTIDFVGMNMVQSKDNYALAWCIEERGTR